MNHRPHVRIALVAHISVTTVCTMALVAMPGCGPRPTIHERTMPDGPPKKYICHRLTAPIVIDGRLDDAAWASAAWTDDFVDIEGPRKPVPRYRTRVKMLWDADHFYVAAELAEPHVWATLTHHDDIVFHDNDFEVFVDPDGDARDYYEIEVNARNTIFDLLLKRTYHAGGPPVHEWDCRGLKSAVFVDGTLNDGADTDRGWSVELALPWTTLAEFARRPSPPQVADEWRVNFSRVQWRTEIAFGRYKIIDSREDNWVWSRQGVINMHEPDRWGFVRFE